MGTVEGGRPVALDGVGEEGQVRRWLAHAGQLGRLPHQPAADAPVVAHAVGLDVERGGLGADEQGDGVAARWRSPGWRSPRCPRRSGAWSTHQQVPGLGVLGHDGLGRGQEHAVGRPGDRLGPWPGRRLRPGSQRGVGRPDPPAARSGRRRPGGRVSGDGDSAMATTAAGGDRTAGRGQPDERRGGRSEVRTVRVPGRVGVGLRAGCRPGAPAPGRVRHRARPRGSGGGRSAGGPGPGRVSARPGRRWSPAHLSEPTVTETGCPRRVWRRGRGHAYARAGRSASRHPTSGRPRPPSESEQAMQFGIIPPVRLGVTADPAWMTSFARHAEACGFESVVLVEHAVVDLGLPEHLPLRLVGEDAPARRLPDPRPVGPHGLSGRGHRADHPGHRGAGRAQPPAGGAGQADRHGRRAVGGPGPDVRGGGMDGRGAAPPPGPTLGAGAAAPTRPSPPCGPCGPTPVRPGPTSTASSSRSATPTRSPSRCGPVGCRSTSGGTARRPPDGPGDWGTASSPSDWRPRCWPPGWTRCGRRPRQAGRDPAAIELSLSGYLPTTTEEDVADAESAGAVRLVVSTSMTGDLDQVHDEMSGFAERFGLG